MGTRAIATRYVGPTSNKASAISVRVGDDRPVRVPYDYDYNATQNFERAARKVATEKGYNIAALHGASARNGMVFVAVVQ